MDGQFDRRSRCSKFSCIIFLNLYKAYADLYGEPPNNDKRIVWGWGGARREINADEVDNSFKTYRSQERYWE